jgi:hypothetical protein
LVHREWYGAWAPNVGLRLTAEQVADGIREREIGDKRVAYAVTDPAIFAEDGRFEHAGTGPYPAPSVSAGDHILPAS